jgi:LPXTG-motif cell wall-anchored protein
MHSRKTLPFAVAAATAITLIGMPAFADSNGGTDGGNDVINKVQNQLPHVPTGKPTPKVTTPVTPKGGKLDVKKFRDGGDNGDGHGHGHGPGSDDDVKTYFHHVPDAATAGSPDWFDLTYVNKGKTDYQYSELTFGVFADNKSSKGLDADNFYSVAYEYGNGDWHHLDPGDCKPQYSPKHEYTISECTLHAGHHAIHLPAGGKVTVHIKLTFNKDLSSPDAGFYAFPRMIQDKDKCDKPVEGMGTHSVFDVNQPNDDSGDDSTPPSSFPTTTATPTTAPTEQVGAESETPAQTQAVSAGLAHTGADATVPIAIGAGAVVVAGGGLLMFARRRRGGSHV